MIVGFLRKNVLYIVWLQAFVATLGSLFFSEVMHFTPCVLCWYQRILMYPLVLILTMGIIRKDKGLAYYVLPLTILGFCIALFHVLLQAGIISEAAAPCKIGVSCKTLYDAWFGFITIPRLSLAAFTIINLGMIYYHRIDHTRSHS